MSRIDDLRKEYQELTQSKVVSQPTTTTQPTATTIQNLKNEYAQLTQKQPVVQSNMSHSQKAQQGQQQLAQKQAAISTLNTPTQQAVQPATQPVVQQTPQTNTNNFGEYQKVFADYLTKNKTASVDDMIQLAKDKGLYTGETKYQLDRMKVSTQPNTALATTKLAPQTIPNYQNINEMNLRKAEENSPVNTYDKYYGKQEAKEEFKTLNFENNNNADKYQEYKTGLVKAEAEGDTRNISKYSNLLEDFKEAYIDKNKGKEKKYDIINLEKELNEDTKYLTQLVERYNSTQDINEKQQIAADYDRVNNQRKIRLAEYQDALAYDELINNNIGKDIATSFGTNVLGGTANIINAGYSLGQIAIGADVSMANAKALYNLANGKSSLSGINSLKILATASALEPNNERLKTLLTQLTNKSYQGTQEDLAQELDEIQKQRYQSFKDKYTQDELDQVSNQLRHNEAAYGKLAAIPNAFGTVGNMTPSILAGIATGGTAELAGGGAMATAGTLANTAQQVGSLGTLGMGAYSGGLDKALQEGATYNQGVGYGLLTGATEVGTELIGGETVNQLFGRYGKTALGKVFGKAVDNLNIESKVGKWLGNQLSGVASEMTEEMISEALNPLWQTITYNPEALPKNLDEVGNYIKDIIKAGVEAVPSTLIMQGSGNVMQARNAQIMENSIIDSISKTDLSPIVKTQLIEEVKKASTDVKLGIEESDIMTDKAWEKYANLSAQSEQMKQRIPQGFTLPQSTIDILAYTENNRPGLNINFDTNIQGNGTFVENADGTRTITLNPNSQRAVEFTLTHELGHDLKGTQEYTQLQNLLEDYAKGKPKYSESLRALEKTYRDSGANFNLKDEATNDMLGQAIGEQEFYNKLAENPTLFERVTNGLKNLLGNKETKLKNKIEKLTRNAYQSAYKGTGSGISNSLSEKTKSKEFKKDIEDRFKELTGDSILVAGGKLGGVDLRNNMRRAGNLGGEIEEYPYSKEAIALFDKYQNSKKSSSYLYHATGIDRLESIIKNGLTTGNKQNQEGVSSDKEIYLSASPELAESYATNNSVTLRIHPKFYDKFENFKNDLLGGEGSYSITNNIPPEMLQIKENNKWIPLLKSNQAKQIQGNTQYSLSEAPTRDNQGRELSKGQQTYFKDSKVRDDSRKLLEVYHGSPDKFTIFDIGKTSRQDRTSQVGTGFYFTNKKSAAEGYTSDEKGSSNKSTLFKVYLNIKNPFELSYKNENQHRLDREKLKQLLLEGDNDYFFNDWIPFVTYTSDALNYKLDGLSREQVENLSKEEKVDYYLRWEYDGDSNGDKNILQVMHRAYNNNSDLLKNFQEILGYDGIIYNGLNGTNQYVVFSPDQIKNVDNLNPTENEDIRYSKQNASWQDFLDQNLNLAQGTKTNFERLPTNEEIQEQETKSIAEEPINKITVDRPLEEYLNQQMYERYGNPEDTTSYSLSEKEQKEVNDYTDKLFEDKTLDERFVTQTYEKIRRIKNYSDFEEIKQEVSDYKDKLYKGISGLEDIANLKPEDAKQREMRYTQLKDKNTTNQRRFFDNMETSPIIADETKNRVNATTYETKHNLDTLELMKDRLDERGDKLVEEWKTKSKNFTDKDVALGAILIERYQQDGDWESAARTVEKLADMGTEAGRAVQMYSIFQRLSPDTMAIYQQKALDKAFEEMKEKQTGKWVEKNKDKFKLTAEDTQFIYEQVQKASEAIDEETKQRELSKIETRINEKLPAKAGDAVRTLRRIAMLFNPKTQVRNVVGNSLIMPVNDVADFIATQIDKLLAKRTGVRTTNYANPFTKAKGFTYGLGQSVKDYKTKTRTSPSGSRWEMEIGNKPFNENTDSRIKNKINKGLNNINDFLSAVMSGGDRPFYEAAYKNSLEGQMKANKVKEATQEMKDIAVNEGLERTWNDDNAYTKFVLDVRRSMNKLNVGGFGLGDLLIPFAKTPANLTKAIVEYSPVGLISSINNYIDLNKAISRGEMTPQQQKKFVNSFGKAIAGSLLYAIAGSLVRTGKITGSGDDDKDVKNFEQNVLGIQPYSVRLGDKTYTYSWANPINAPLAIMADSYKLNKENASLYDQVSNAIKVGGDVLLENSFLQGISEIFKNQEGPVAGLVESVESMPESLIPTFLSQIASAFDDTKRQTYEYGNKLGTQINKIKSKIPGARNTLEPSVNTFGEEIENQNNAFNVFLNPANVREATTTEAQQELYSLYEATKDKTIFPMQAPSYVSKDGEKVNLSSKDKATYQKASGQYVTEVYDALFDSDFYNSLKIKDDDKVEMLKKVAEDGNAMGKIAVGANTSTTDKLQEKIDTIRDADIPLADYYISWYAQKDQKNKKGKKTAISQSISTYNDDTKKWESDLTNEQKKVLYEVFNLN